VPGDSPFTPEATIGPFYPGAFVGGMPQDLWTVAPLVAHHPEGQPIVVTLRFFDQARQPVPSLVVEFWQANAHGRYRHALDRSAAPLDPQFEGFARLRSDDAGTLTFHSIKPGARAPRAPHLRLTIFASGIDRLVTQIFFDDEPLNASDRVLASIGDPVVADRLIAKRTRLTDAASPREYALDVVLRGDGETPFFDDWS